MFARWNRMAKQFTRIGKDITIAVRSGGPEPDNNPTLRRVIQNARAVNMPKDKVESAIKRATSKDVTNYEEVIYEGYAPHGVAVLVQTATDNPTRTVSNIRNVFNKNGGNLGTSGSVSFMFRRMGVFRLDPERYRSGRPRAVSDRPRPGRDGRGQWREGRAAAGDPLQFCRILASCRRAWKTAISRRCLPSRNTSARRPPNFRKIRRGKCLSSSTSLSRTRTCRRSFIRWCSGGRYCG